MIGADGLTAAVEGGRCCAEGARPDQGARVQRRPRRARRLLATLADTLNAAPIQHIGKLLVLWRPIPPKEASKGPARRPCRTAGGQAAEVLQERQPPAQVKKVKVLGNER
jgi:RNA-binding protein